MIKDPTETMNYDILEGMQGLAYTKLLVSMLKFMGHYGTISR